jgi:hypothetical protein
LSHTSPGSRFTPRAPEQLLSFNHYKGKTPRAYFLTRKGWEILSRESDIPPELIGSHKEIHVESRWSPQMYHRLHTVDLMISALESFDGQLHGSEFILYRA